MFRSSIFPNASAHEYVLSLSGSPHDSTKAALGKDKFAACAACHGADGKGNPALGAPNLTDKTWLYGAGVDTIVEGITKGRNNVMPAHKDFLGDAKVHLLAAYVYSAAGAGESTTDMAWDGHGLVCENGSLLAQTGRFASGAQLLHDADQRAVDEVEGVDEQKRKQNVGAIALRAETRMRLRGVCHGRRPPRRTCDEGERTPQECSSN